MKMLAELAELAELALVLARDLQQSALSADTADEKVRFTDAFHTVGRGLRQSLALQARLERDLVRAAREDASHARAETERRIVRRKAEVTAHPRRLRGPRGRLIPTASRS